MLNLPSAHEISLWKQAATLKVVAVLFACIVTLNAAEYSFEPLPGYPGGINSAGTSVGYDATGTGNAFLRLSSGAVTLWKYPGSWTTFAQGINTQGQSVGSYYLSEPFSAHGLLRESDRTILQIDYPGSVYGQLSGINDAGDIVGYFNDGVDNIGYVRDSAGNFTILSYAGAAVIIPDAINNHGQIAGHLRMSDNSMHAFLLDRATNAYTLFAAPSCSDTIAYGINDAGVIAGVCQSGPFRGFIRNPDGTFRQFTYGITGINDRGQIVGVDAFSLVGFLATPIPPVTTAHPAPDGNAIGWNNTNVTVNLNGTDVDGPGVKDIRYALGGAQNTGWETVLGDAASVTISAEGTTTLSYFATDNAGNQEKAKALTIKIDKTPPLISGMPAPGCTIWPPNHKLVRVATVTAADTLSGLVPGSFRVTGIRNDPANGQIVITGGGNQFNVQLGADKDVAYTLTATATDPAGNTATVTATCTVPHDTGI